MAEISSSLGSRSFEAPEMKTFTVPNEENAPQYSSAPVAQQAPQYHQQPQMTPDEAMNMRRQYVQNAEQSLSQSARQRVEFLIGIGTASTDIVLESGTEKTIFTVRTLKSGETSHITRLTSKLAAEKVPDAIFVIRKNILAHSLLSIDGVSIEDILEIRGLSEDDKRNRKINFIDQFDDVIINFIYRKWEELHSRHLDKYKIKDDKDAKEVAEAINKSSQGA